MKQHLILLTAATAALALASCVKNEITAPGVDNSDPAGRVAVQFTGATLDVAPAAASTRSESAWTREGDIGIYMVGEASLEIADEASNRHYRWQTSQRSFIPDDAAQTIYFPVDGSKRRFAAYYPWQDLTGTTYKVDLTTQPSLNDQATFELLWTGVTEGYDKTQPTVALNFDHQYAKEGITVQNGTGISADDRKQIAVTMTEMHLRADFDVLTGAMTPTDAAGALTFARNSDGSRAYALVLPTEADAARTMDFTLGDDTFRWAIPEKKFEAGKEYDYTVKVSRTPLGITATITDWEEGESGSGDAE